MLVVLSVLLAFIICSIVLSTFNLVSILFRMLAVLSVLCLPVELSMSFDQHRPNLSHLHWSVVTICPSLLLRMLITIRLVILGSGLLVTIHPTFKAFYMA